MFYADFVLSKKGPLARIWLAAHWDKKLTKAQIFETNIESSIERILRPKVKLALRTSGHLMLGVVRIYSRKTKYLLADCNEAFVKIKMAFRPGMVDLPEDHREAAVSAVTLPEVFHDFDSAMLDLNDVDIEVHFQVNQSRADEITIREDYGNVHALQDGFDLGFDASNAFLGPGFDQSDPSNATGRDGYEQSLQARDLLVDERIPDIDLQKDRSTTSDGILELPPNLDASKVDDFGPVSDGEFLGLFEDPEVRLVDDTLNMNDPIDMDPLPSTSKMLSPFGSPRNQIGQANLNDDDFDDHFIPPSPGGGSSDGSRPQSPIHSAGPSAIPGSVDDQFQMPIDEPNLNDARTDILAAAEVDGQNAGVAESADAAPNAEQTTLLQNEEESFALAPVDASALRGLAKTKRKRKLIVDEVKNISGEEMKAQLSDTSDIVITLDLAPPTKRLMHWKETGGVEKLFALPGKIIPSTALYRNYQRHLTSKMVPNEDGVDDGEHLEGVEGQDGLDPNIPVAAPPAPVRRGRKRKQLVVEEELAPIPEEISKKTRISAQDDESNDANHLATMGEGKPATPSGDITLQESNNVNVLPSSTPFRDPSNACIPDWLAESNQMLQPPSVAPANTAPESNSQLPPYPNTDGNNELCESIDQVRTETSEVAPLSSSVFQPFSEANIDAPAVHCGQTSGINVMPSNNDTMMENMGYDGHDHDIQNQDPNVPAFSFNDDNDLNPITPGINTGGGITPWHDADYDNPVSVGPPIDEREQQRTDETMEQFEERILNKRAGQLYSTVRMRIITGADTSFDDLIISNSRKQIAQRFYSLLVLKKARVLELTQTEPYGTIKLTKGPNFDDPKL